MTIEHNNDKMTSDKKYTVVFTGKVRKGQDVQNVRRRLADIFKTDVRKISAIFLRDGSVIKRNLDYQKALQYVSAIKNAGAVCRIVEEEVEQERKRPRPDTARPVEDSDRHPGIISIKLGTAQLTSAPVVSNRITGWSDGINLNRNEKQEVAYQEIALVSVFKNISSFQEKYQLVFFVHNERRPYIVDGNLIAYSDFPIEREVSTIASLRSFLNHLCNKNKDILIEENTYEFISGKQPMTFNDDVVLLTSALARALVSDTDVSQSS